MTRLTQAQVVAQRYEELKDTVMEYLNAQARAGETQVLLRDVRQRLLLVSGRPTGMAEIIARDLLREGRIKDFLQMGKDGLVYMHPFTPKEEA